MYHIYNIQEQSNARITLTSYYSKMKIEFSNLHLLNKIYTNHKNIYYVVCTQQSWKKLNLQTKLWYCEIADGLPSTRGIMSFSFALTLHVLYSFRDRKMPEAFGKKCNYSLWRKFQQLLSIKILIVQLCNCRYMCMQMKQMKS